MHTAYLHISFEFFKNLFTYIFTQVLTQHTNIQQCVIVKICKQQTRQKAVTNFHTRIMKTVIFREIEEI